MNNPEYILTDVLRQVTATVSGILTADDPDNFPNAINFQHGYLNELDETLQQWEKDTTGLSAVKFPLIWVAEPFTERRGLLKWYASVNDLNIFIFNGTDKNWKSDERDTSNYNPKIYPIYRMFMKQLHEHPALDFEGSVANPQRIKHDKVKGYYFSDGTGKSYLTDVVDCLKIGNLNLLINNNDNCS